jgi:hypothetical protein
MLHLSVVDIGHCFNGRLRSKRPGDRERSVA